MCVCAVCTPRVRQKTLETSCRAAERRIPVIITHRRKRKRANGSRTRKKTGLQNGCKRELCTEDGRQSNEETEKKKKKHAIHNMKEVINGRELVNSYDLRVNKLYGVTSIFHPQQKLACIHTTNFSDPTLICQQTSTGMWWTKYSWFDHVQLGECISMIPKIKFHWIASITVETPYMR